MVLVSTQSPRFASLRSFIVAVSDWRRCAHTASRSSLGVGGSCGVVVRIRRRCAHPASLCGPGVIVRTPRDCGHSASCLHSVSRLRSACLRPLGVVVLTRRRCAHSASLCSLGVVVLTRPHDPRWSSGSFCVIVLVRSGRSSLGPTCVRRRRPADHRARLLRTVQGRTRADGLRLPPEAWLSCRQTRRCH